MPGIPRHCLPLFLLALLMLIPAGCVSEKVGYRSSMRDQLTLYSDDEVYEFSPLDSRYNLDPPVGGDLSTYQPDEQESIYDPFKKYSGQTYYGAGETITRHYYFPPGRGEDITRLLISHVPGLTRFGSAGVDTLFNQDPQTGVDPRMTPNQVLLIKNAVQDKRPSRVKDMGTFANYDHATGMVGDLLVVKTEGPEKLMAIDSFLSNLLTELPIIEIKVRVVEVAMSDEFQWGVENIISKDTSSSKAFLKDWFNFYNTESFTRAGNDVNDFQGSLFNAWGLHDKIELDATFELLQRITDSDILSAPTIAVLNGHRAIIETGDKVPKQEIVSTAVTAYYNYKFEQTGVKLVIVPYLLPGDLIEVHINAEVVAVTGRETFDTPVGTLSQPILSTRQASTRVRIKEGQAMALGGLMSTAEFDLITKLPLLGDIPILGNLFKTKDIEKVRSQIIFYIEPHVVTREDGWKDRGGDG